MCIQGPMIILLPNFPGPTFIPYPTSIPEARVDETHTLFNLSIRDMVFEGAAQARPKRTPDVITIVYPFQFLLLGVMIET